VESSHLAAPLEDEMDEYYQDELKALVSAWRAKTAKHGYGKACAHCADQLEAIVLQRDRSLRCGYYVPDSEGKGCDLARGHAGLHAAR